VSALQRRALAALPVRDQGVTRSRILGTAALCAGVGLGALALPQAFNSLHLAAGDKLMLQLIHVDQRDQALPGQIRQHLAAATAWYDNTAARLAQAQLDLVEARGRDFEGPQARLALERAIAAVGNALRLAPGEPRAWTLLLQLRYLRDSDDPAIAAITARAIAAAPGDVRFLRIRVDIGLRVWSAADLPAQRAIARETRLLAQSDVAAFVALIKRAGTIGAARDALADDPALRQRVEAAYLQSP